MVYYLIDFKTNGFYVGILDIIISICIFFGIYTIISPNPVVAVLFLIGLFTGISIYLMIVGLIFLGLSYLLVYIGAVSILFLFILMLINIRIAELISNNNNYLPLSILIIIPFIYILGQIIPLNTKFNIENSLDLNLDFSIWPSKDDINFTSSNSWDITLTGLTDINNIGNIMYSTYSIWLIMISLILLLSMVGAIVITKS
ncbi:NADH dehydrogenase subunit 6 (mitochondrion) [Coccidioides posadasii str. Silveira]|uniref:NADH dehydrogenase subunit 6 n=1 Tax=Coccidioides posadasii TaxID=199306 RepID=UPI0010284A90|nr:NADH dehydrogenase subunit 6 [Coccidioides posadasii]YP_010183906.1 NADH dehydrogenase subunit 6 [Coccidioides immitis]QVG61989.1 NADH dehydrogenase subunit 6 [Coccidioides posadasii]QVG62029.1 NADH dehydrogenase subunit 6 [Coccidioides immitis]UKA47926.1 NADH dehydrogenase subunit 6 [Coccidioides posadasii str. Silveira]